MAVDNTLHIPERDPAETRPGSIDRRGPSSSVTELAFGAGFTHLGRFSEIYRKAYGESPNETLARSREASRRTKPKAGKP